MSGREGVSDAIALLERSMTEASMNGQRSFPLRAVPRAAAHMDDLSAWLAGSLDTDRTLLLARALMAVDADQWAQNGHAMLPASQADWPDDAWLVLRLAHLHGQLPNKQVVPCDPAILRRLASGDASSAVALALRRLRASGMRLAVRSVTTSATTARLWAAALAFPIHHRDVQRIVTRLDPAFAKEHTT